MLRDIPGNSAGVPLPRPPLDILLLNGLTLDAAAEKWGFVFAIPRSGSITKILFRTGTVTVADTLRVALRTVDASGDPTTTAYGGMAAGTQSSPASNTQYTVTLATPATAVRGDIAAIVIDFNSFVAGNLQIAHASSGNAPHIPSFPYVDHFTAAWSKQTIFAPVAIEYSDGTYIEVGNASPWSAASTTTSFNSGSTPDERALKFSVPFECKMVGVWGFIAAAAAGNFDIVLYEGTTAVASFSHDGDHRAATTANYFERPLATPYTIKRNTTYYLAVKPTSANNASLVERAVGANAHLDAFSGGKNWVLSTRTDGGAWSDTNTTRPMIGLLVGGFHDGAV